MSMLCWRRLTSRERSRGESIGELKRLLREEVWRVSSLRASVAQLAKAPQ